MKFRPTALLFTTLAAFSLAACGSDFRAPPEYDGPLTVPTKGGGGGTGGDTTPPPAPPSPTTLFPQATAETAEFSITIGTVGQWQDPWPAGQPVRLFLKFVHKKSTTVSVPFMDGGWADLDVAPSTSSTPIFSLFGPPVSDAVLRTIGRNEIHYWDGVWAPSGVTPGTYRVTAVMHTMDPLVPQPPGPAPFAATFDLHLP